MEKIVLKSVDEIYNNYGSFIEGKKKGTFELPVEVASITSWYRDPSPYSIITGIPRKDMESVIYYSSWIVTDPGDTQFLKNSVISDPEFRQAVETYGEGSFSAEQGAPAIGKVIKSLDIDCILASLRSKETEYMMSIERLKQARHEASLTGSEKRMLKKYRKELETLRVSIDAAFYLRENPDAFLIKKVTLFPLRIRAVLEDMSCSMTYGIYHDIEDLYERVFIRAKRLEKLIDINAPEIILRNEKRILQENVDDLFANGLRGEPVVKGGGIPLISLADVFTRSIAG